MRIADLLEAAKKAKEAKEQAVEVSEKEVDEVVEFAQKAYEDVFPEQQAAHAALSTLPDVIYDAKPIGGGVFATVYLHGLISRPGEEDEILSTIAVLRKNISTRIVWGRW